MTEKITKPDDDWRHQLTDEQFRVTGSMGLSVRLVGALTAIMRPELITAFAVMRHCLHLIQNLTRALGGQVSLHQLMTRR